MASKERAPKNIEKPTTLEQIADGFSALAESDSHDDSATRGGSLLLQAARLGLYDAREYVIERIIIEAGMAGRLHHEPTPWTTTPETQEKTNHLRVFMAITRMSQLNGSFSSGPTEEELIQSACEWFASFIRKRADDPSEPVVDQDAGRIIELTDHLGAILHQILRWRTAHAGLTIGKTLKQQAKISNSIAEMARQSELTLLAVEAAKTRTSGIDALVHLAFGTEPGNWGWRLNRMLRQFRWFLYNNSPEYPVGNDGTLMQTEFEKVQGFYLDLLDLDVNSLASPPPTLRDHVDAQVLEELRRGAPRFEKDGVVWVSNKIAAERIGVETNTLRNYRHAGSHTPDGLFGMDSHNQVWQKKRPSNHPWYLRETLRTGPAKPRKKHNS